MNNKTIAALLALSFILLLLAGGKVRANQETYCPIGWTCLTKQIPTPTPDATDSIVLPIGVEDIIRFNFKDLGENKVKEAIRVAKCESGLRSLAENTTKNKDKTRDDGVFQVNSVHNVPVKFLHNPRVNIPIARQLYDEWHGWGAWVSSNNCHHLVKGGDSK